MKVEKIRDLTDVELKNQERDWLISCSSSSSR